MSGTQESRETPQEDLISNPPSPEGTEDENVPRRTPGRLRGAGPSVPVHAGSKTRLVPKIFVDGNEKRYFKTNLKQLRFLNAWEKTEGNLGDAISQSGISRDELKKFLRQKDFRGLMDDRLQKIAVMSGWATAGTWWKYAEEVMNGKRMPSREQIVVWQEMGKRVKPAAREGESNNKDQVVINISGNAVLEAEKRMKTLDVKVDG